MLACVKTIVPFFMNNSWRLYRVPTECGKLAVTRSSVAANTPSAYRFCLSKLAQPQNILLPGASGLAIKGVYLFRNGADIEVADRS
jgi:hypothetical protein